MSKLIAYIDRKNKDCGFRAGVFKTELAPDFRIFAFSELDSDVLSIIKGNLDSKNNPSYQALVTHFPYDMSFLGNQSKPLEGEAFYKKAYQRSIKHLNQIKSAHPDFPVILYTGMMTDEVPKDHEKRKIVDCFLDGLNIDAYLYKGRDYNWDAKRIKGKLCEVLGE